MSIQSRVQHHRFESAAQEAVVSLLGTPALEEEIAESGARGVLVGPGIAFGEGGGIPGLLARGRCCTASPPRPPCARWRSSGAPRTAAGRRPRSRWRRRARLGDFADALALDQIVSSSRPHGSARVGKSGKSMKGRIEPTQLVG